MAEQQQQQPSNVLAAAFPSPPPFFQHFTVENIERIAALRAAKQAESFQPSSGPQSNSNETSGTKQALRLLDLPPELRFLQPPEPPAEGVYRSFGDVFNVSYLWWPWLALSLILIMLLKLNEGLPSLAEQGIDQLYTPPGTPSASGSGSHSDRALILKRIAKSLLLNFLELMGIMSINPEQYAEKIQDLRTLFINFHHLLNEYRPHQARESLIMMMEDQLERSNSETAGIERMKAKVEGILNGLGEAKLANGDVEGNDALGSAGKIDDDTLEVAIWEELAKELG